MAVEKFNKILSPTQTGAAATQDGQVAVSGSGQLGSSQIDEQATAFLNSLTNAELSDIIYLGAGPHQKNKTAIKISDPIPTRATVSNPETFFTQTISGYYDPTWELNKVYIQADSTETGTRSVNIGLTTSLVYTVKYVPTGATYSPAGVTPSGSQTVDITAGFGAGAGQYEVTVKLSGTTTCGLSSPLYLVGIAPDNSVWVGTPTIASDGTISYDMSIQMPEITGIEDWEVEISEL